MRLIHISVALIFSLSLSACIDVYRGALVQFNLQLAENSAPTEHYELWAVINGGAVSLGQFKVRERVAQCGAPADITSELQVVQRYDDGVDHDTLCSSDRRLGAIDKNDLAAGSLAGGVRIDTDVDLRDATRVFISVEADGDPDPSPATVIMAADLAPGVAPFHDTKIQCVADFCDSIDSDHPAYATLCGANLPSKPRARRGVLAGVFLKQPAAEDACAFIELGQISVVPAEDETFL